MRRRIHRLSICLSGYLMNKVLRLIFCLMSGTLKSLSGYLMNKVLRLEASAV